MIKFILFFLFCFFIAASNAQDLGLAEKNVISNTENDPLWKNFANRIRLLRQQENSQIIIVHLGDSHVQGGYFTNRFRDLLTGKYGEAGRGFVFPYSLAKTNGPEDVKFSSSNNWESIKYNYSPTKSGIEGYNFFCPDTFAKISLKVIQESDKVYPFTEMVFYYDNAKTEIYSISGYRPNVQMINPQLYAANLQLDSPVNESSVYFRNSSGIGLHGIELKNKYKGIRYHSIGVNGLTYNAYVNYLDYLPLLKALHPDCIIISLGTNDAFVKKLNAVQIQNSINSMLSSIRKEIPGSCILLTTPGDHIYSRKMPNPNIPKVQNIIIQTALAQKCVYWDFFTVMGGSGSSKKWSKMGGMYRDNVHLSKLGYKWQGEMLFEAFSKAVEEGN